MQNPDATHHYYLRSSASYYLLINFSHPALAIYALGFFVVCADS